MAEIKEGQVWASTSRRDTMAPPVRQRREVIRVNESFVWLATNGMTSCVRLRRTADGWTIPGHRLVEDAP
jgi:hypothetical protein